MSMDFAALDMRVGTVLAAEPSERIALLRDLAAEPASALQARAVAALNTELSVERAYADVSQSVLRDADARAARGDVRGLQQVIARALAADERLGSRRPGQMAALLATLDARLSEAHQVRAAQEALFRRGSLFRAYADSIARPRKRFRDLRRTLDQVRSRSGTSIRRLQSMEIDATLALYDLERVEPPAELQAAHGMLVAAFHMARNAAALRRNALSSERNPQLAWDASSAAAGAFMLAERGTDELNRLISLSSKPPR